MKKVFPTQLIYSNNKPAFVALLSVVVVSLVVLAISITIVFVNINYNKGNLLLLEAEQARNLASTCSEYALFEISEDETYVGNQSFILDKGECSYEVLDLGLDDKEVKSQGELKNIIKREKIIISSTTPDIIIDSWQEVSSF